MSEDHVDILDKLNQLARLTAANNYGVNIKIEDGKVTVSGSDVQRGEGVTLMLNLLRNGVHPIHSPVSGGQVVFPVNGNFEAKWPELMAAARKYRIEHLQTVLGALNPNNQDDRAALAATLKETGFPPASLQVGSAVDRVTASRPAPRDWSRVGG